MDKLLIILVVLHFGSHVMARVFWETVKPFESRLQYVPPAKVTAQKMSEYLFHRHGADRLAKRDVHYPTDVLIIIDSSKSVPERNFTQGLRALQELVFRFPTDTNFAAITYSTDAQVNFQFVSATKALDQLIQIQYNAGFTNTQAALRKARKMFLSRKSGIRWDAYKAVFILTDGQSNIKKKQTLYRAQLLKQLGITIYVMAVGERIQGITELAMLATSTSNHLYRVAEMDGFMGVITTITRDQGYSGTPDITKM
ncbi:uncharacterized protein LOC116619544 isoform X2 [Nematostella vectensis]|uniref:uncharacterized protein LOC116619544 isoform X2 n=1 Tax=Nematostella vectensis TaxID=45351 RepID=UPI00138FB09C|nr:uncharacterized protein LOC116619544 isoform X2 [Nematostella vectensis]